MDKKHSEFGDTEKLRSIQREAQKDLRQQKKRCILSKRREYLSEVEKSFSSVSCEEMRKLAVTFKDSKENQLLYMQQIRNAAIYGESHIEAFLGVSGALQKIVGHLCGRNAQLVLEAAACITNLSTGSHKSTREVLNIAGSYLVIHMQGNNHLLQDQCAWAVGNIANDCEKCFVVLKFLGVIPVLQSLLSSTYPEVVQSALYAMNALTQYKSLDLLPLIRNGLPSCLITILDQDDISASVAAEALFVIWNISSKFELIPDAELQKVVGVVLKQLQRATKNDEDFDVVLAVPAVRCLGGISVGTSYYCKLVLRHETFEASIRKIVSSKYNFLSKELLWVMTNLFNYKDFPESPASWKWVLDFITPFLSPLSDSAIQAIYFLCVLKATKKDFDSVFETSGLFHTVTNLCNFGKEEIKTAANAFCGLMGITPPTVIC